MADSPIISIIIPVFNGDYIEECMESCLYQTLPPEDLEIIVIDDASTDDTVERILKMSDSFPIHLIKMKKNGGPAAARNAGLSVAKGEYISFLDADDMMKADKLEKQLAFCRSNSSIEAVISGIEEIDKNDALIRNLVRTFSDDLKTQVEILFLDNLHTITSTLFFKRNLLDSTGLMNPGLLNLEDMEFALKLLQYTTMYYYPECLTVRRVLNTGLSYSVTESIFIKSRKEFLTSAIPMHPFLEVLVNRYWALNYTRLGRILQRQGDGIRARHYHYLSLRHKFNWIGLFGYMLSYFPENIQQQIAGNTWKTS